MNSSQSPNPQKKLQQQSAGMRLSTSIPVKLPSGPVSWKWTMSWWLFILWNLGTFWWWFHEQQQGKGVKSSKRWTCPEIKDRMASHAVEEFIHQMNGTVAQRMRYSWTNQYDINREKVWNNQTRLRKIQNMKRLGGLEKNLDSLYG